MEPRGYQSVRVTRKHMSYKPMKYHDFLKSKVIAYG